MLSRVWCERAQKWMSTQKDTCLFNVCFSPDCQTKLPSWSSLGTCYLIKTVGFISRAKFTDKTTPHEELRALTRSALPEFFSSVSGLLSKTVELKYIFTHKHQVTNSKTAATEPNVEVAFINKTRFFSSSREVLFFKAAKESHTLRVAHKMRHSSANQSDHSFIKATDLNWSNRV